MDPKDPPPQTIKLPDRRSDEILYDEYLDERDRAGKGPKPGRMWDFIASLMNFDQKEGK